MSRPAHLLYTIATGLLLALVPSFLLAALLGMVRRRALSSKMTLILWLLLCAIAVFLLGVVDILGKYYGNSILVWIFAGNPIAGMAFILFPDFLGNASIPSSIEYLFMPVTLCMIITCAVLIIVQTVLELRKLRDLISPQPLRKRKRGKPDIISSEKA